MSDQIEQTPAAETTTESTPQTETPRMSRAERLAATIAKAQKDDEAPASEAAAEETPPTDPEAAPPAKDSTGDASAAASDAGEKPKDEPKKADDKLAPKFAALAREKADVLKLRTEHAASVRVFEDQKRAAVEEHQRRSADLDKREARIREAEEADHKLLAEDPRKVFDHLIKIGITDKAALTALADGRWAEHRERMQRKAEAEKPVDEKSKPLTRAELDAEWERREREREARAHGERNIEAFDKGFEATNEDGSDKYDAALTVYSREERIAKGQEIGAALLKSGKQYADIGAFHEDVREAVNALAEREARWQRALKKRGPQASAAPTSPAGTPPATKAPATSARQSSPGQSTPPAKTEASPQKAPTTTNGVTSPNGYRESRKQRLSRLMNDG